MTTETYQGWTNRETWAANLHLSNDEGLYTMTRELVATGDAENRGPRAAADALETFVTEELRGMAADSPGLQMMFDEIGSLWRVDWQEVAGAFRDE